MTSIAQEAFLVQLLTEGFMHSDPHPVSIDVDKSCITLAVGKRGKEEKATRRLLQIGKGVRA